MRDELVKSHIEWLRGDHELCNPFLADRIETLQTRAEKSEVERDALRDAVADFATEIRAYQSPECEECPILGPLLKRADDLTGNPAAQKERDDG